MAQDLEDITDLLSVNAPLSIEADTCVLKNDIRDLCQRNHAEYLLNKENILPFTNSNLVIYEQGVDARDLKKDKSKVSAGIFGIGYCWWHSRFTLNSSLVSSFNDPQGIEVKTDEDAKKVVKSIRRGKIVRVKNYKNLSEFGAKYEQLIKRELNKWQLSDTLKGYWINGLKGKPVMKSEKLDKHISEIYEVFQKDKKPIYQILQVKGLMAHSWVVINIERKDDVYTFTAIDSLYPFPVRATFKANSGQNYLRYDWEQFWNSKDPDFETKQSYLGVNLFFVPQQIKASLRERKRLNEELEQMCSSN
ncbi:MAG: hypothetical protein ACOVP4_12790 [Bacteriovoracaceae bacterium]